MALLLGFLAGFAGASFLSANTTPAIAAITLGVVTAGAVGLVQKAVMRIGTAGVELVSGRRPGHRRFGPEAFHQARVMAHLGGRRYEPEQWVDLQELDHVGFYYGIASSPTYIPLYGNGLAEIDDIQISCDDEPTPPRSELDHQAQGLIEAKSLELQTAHTDAGRPFHHEPLVRLLRWQPPVSATTPLSIQAERVAHSHYVAAKTLLREDNEGSLRKRFGVTARNFENPIVRGALGVEVAVMTADDKLLLAHRSNTTTDYQDQIVVSFGRGMHPDLDENMNHPGQLDPWKAVARGVGDELGIEVDGTKTRFLALGAELTRMDPDLLGYIEVPHTSSEIQSAFIAGRPRDRWETRTLTFVECSVDAVADLLSGPQSRELTPPTSMNLVYALSHRFGEATTQRALAR